MPAPPTRAIVLSVLAALAVAATLASSPATAGPLEEPDGPSLFVGYPGFFTVAPGARRVIVAYVRIDHLSGPETFPLKVCVDVDGFDGLTVNGRRKNAWIANGGQRICWPTDATSRGDRISAIVRADAPGSPGDRRTFRMTTTVELYQAGNTTAAESNEGTVRVKRRSRR